MYFSSFIFFLSILIIQNWFYLKPIIYLSLTGKIYHIVKFMNILLFTWPQRIRDKIEEIRDKELSLDDLDADDSAYIYEDRLQKKFVKVWNKLCQLKGRSTSSGRPIERRFKFESRFTSLCCLIWKKYLGCLWVSSPVLYNSFVVKGFNALLCYL